MTKPMFFVAWPSSGRGGRLQPDIRPDSNHKGPLEQDEADTYNEHASATFRQSVMVSAHGLGEFSEESEDTSVA